MLDLTGEAVLALWNSVEETRAREYNAWHTQEHVPERVGIAGMLGARRYVKLKGPLPEYLTLYSLETIKVLRSEPYRALLDNPSPWSRRMRPSLRDFLRIPCRRLMSTGGGLGGLAAAYLLDENEILSVSLRVQLQTLTRMQGLVAVHLLVRDRSIPDVPFQRKGERPDFPDGGAILLESHDEGELVHCLPEVAEILRGEGVVGAEQIVTTYRLAYAIDRGSLQGLIPLDPVSKGPNSNRP